MDLAEEVSSEREIFETNHKGIAEMIGLGNHACLDGLDQDHIPLKEYLSIFASGQCSPILLVPGIAGSKLVVRIDCPVLKRENPEVFKSCGFTACQEDESVFGR